MKRKKEVNINEVMNLLIKYKKREEIQHLEKAIKSSDLNNFLIINYMDKK